MYVSEIFESIQGEGPEVGIRAVFLRLAGCNLHCPACDTKYAWHNGNEASVDEVKHEILRYEIPNLIITGGEPLMQKAELEALLKDVRSDFRYIGLETNGTIHEFDDRYFDRIVISPKRMFDLVYWLPIVRTDDRYWLKIVTDGHTWGLSNHKLDSLLPILDTLDHPHVMFMPEGTTLAAVVENIRNIYTWMWKHQVKHIRITPRLHVMVNMR